jgi:hypothetical protein
MALSIPRFAEVVEMHAGVISVKIIAYWLTHGDGVEGRQFVLEDWGVSTLSFETDGTLDVEGGIVYGCLEKSRVGVLAIRLLLTRPDRILLAIALRGLPRSIGESALHEGKADCAARTAVLTSSVVASATVPDC